MCFAPQRPSGVQFLISHLARWLRTRHFSEPTFRPSGATNHWKNTVPFRAPVPSFFSLFLFLFLFIFLFIFLFLFLFLLFLFLFLFSSLLFSSLPTSAFPLSILSEVCLTSILNFLRLCSCADSHWQWCASQAAFAPRFLKPTLLFLTMLSNLDLLNVQANFSRTACWRQSSRWSRPARTLKKNPSWVWTGQR